MPTPLVLIASTVERRPLRNSVFRLGRRPPTERHISPTAKASLETFAHSLPADSPLRASLERLVRRGKD